MRFRKVGRYRSAAWWGVFIWALLLVGAYVVFDILDVDGSQMDRWPGHDMGVVATPEVAAERFFRLDPATPGSTELLAASLSRLSSTESKRLLSGRTHLRTRQSRALPRMNLAAEHARGSSPTVDPV